jgi:16S rRNA (cytosine967-C5)-methyltransferase
MSLSREAALQALLKYEEAGAHLRETLEELFRESPGLSPRDRAFCRELAGGVVRRLNTLDWAIALFAGWDSADGVRGLTARASAPQAGSASSAVQKLSAHVRNILRLGACQVLYMADRVPPYAAVHEAVESAKKHSRPGVASFVNGLLRNLERHSRSLPWPDEAADPVAALSLKHSHPAWLVRRWLERFGAEECAALLRKNNETPWMSVRVNTLKHDRAGLFRRLIAEDAEPELSRLSLDGIKFREAPALSELKSFREGGFQVQDEASQLAVDVLDPRPGETVADLCAGPGGKSTHIAERLRNEGAVLAFDTDTGRLQLVRENAKRLGASAVRTELLDGREAARRHAGAADRVLVDAPCSSLGILRRRPDLRWNKQGRDVASTFPALQAELLRGAAVCAKPGGVIVYATCTMEPEENEAVAESFLKEAPGCRVEPAGPFLAPSLRGAVTPEGYLRLLPHRHDTDGFFIARFRKG